MTSLSTDCSELREAFLKIMMNSMMKTEEDEKVCFNPSLVTWGFPKCKILVQLLNYSPRVRNGNIKTNMTYVFAISKNKTFSVSEKFPVDTILVVVRNCDIFKWIFSFFIQGRTIKAFFVPFRLNYAQVRHHTYLDDRDIKSMADHFGSWQALSFFDVWLFRVTRDRKSAWIAVCVAFIFRRRSF